jgi:hypothetical protein
MAEMPTATVAVKYRWSPELTFIIIDVICNGVIAYTLSRTFPLEAYRTFILWTLFFALCQSDRIVRALKAGGTHAL